MSSPIAVMIVDDHTMFRDALRDRLAQEMDITVVGDVGSAGDAVTAARAVSPDVILMDIDMPGPNCFEAAAAIVAEQRDTHIIFVSAYEHDHYISRALAVRAAGYVTKGEPVKAVIGAIRAAAEGERTFSASVADRIVVDEHGARLAATAKTRAAILSERETEILRYLARGMSRKEIAETTGISAETVHKHTSSLMRKLGIHDRVQLARFAIREGLIDP